MTIPFPNSNEHDPSAMNVRELINQLSDMSRKNIALCLGIHEKTLEAWAYGRQDIPYTAQYTLEVMIQLENKQ